MVSFFSAQSEEVIYLKGKKMNPSFGYIDGGESHQFVIIDATNGLTARLLCNSDLKNYYLQLYVYSKSGSFLGRAYQYMDYQTCYSHKQTLFENPTSLSISFGELDGQWNLLTIEEKKLQ